MLKKKRTLFILCGIFIILLLVFIVIFFTLPPFIDSQLTKDRLLKDVEERTGIRADYSNAETWFFPFPTVTLHHGTLKAPAKVQATFQSLRISPRILPLLIGKLRIDAIHIESPVITAEAPYLREGTISKEGLLGGTLQGHTLSLGGVLASLAAQEITLVVRNGQIFLEQGHELFFSLSETEVSFAGRSGSLNLRVTATSNLCKRMEFDGQLDVKSFMGQGEMKLEGFLPESIVPHLFPRLPLQFPDSEINLHAHLEVQGSGSYLVTYGASIPAMTLRRGGEEQMISGNDIEGRVHLQPASLEIVLDRSRFENPRIGLSGRFTMDSTTRATFLEVNGIDVDAAGFGRVFLLVLGEHRTIQRIFEIIRGGRVPSIQFVSRGGSPREIHEPENFVIRGSMIGGRIHVPRAELDVEEASGEVVISKAVMEGRNLQGRTGNSLGRNGSLTIGFKKDQYGDAPFKLDIDLDADLAELPMVLERVVENEGFLHEIGLIRKIRGRARGRLVLGESFKAVKTRVDATEFSAAASYDRIPYPIDVRGRDFFYEGSLVRIGLLEGSLGKSLLSGVSGSIDWNEESYLRISAASHCSVSLEEIFAWLISYENLRKSLRNYDSLKGLMHVERLDLEGPTRRSLMWKFAGRGTVENFAASSTFTPKPLEVKTGALEANQDELVVKDCAATLLDAPIILSGTLRGFWKELSDVDLILSGTVTPQFNLWLMGILPGKRYLELRSPYSVSQGKLSWSRKEKFGFSGSIVTKDGTLAEVDLESGLEEFILHRLRIKDGESDATVSSRLRENVLSIGFTGNLNNRSVNRLLQDNPVQAGVLKGKLQAVVGIEDVGESQLHGEFFIQGFQWTSPRLAPLLVENASGSAAGNTITIQESSISWNDAPMRISGRAVLSKGACNLDVNLRAEHIDWETMHRVVDESQSDSTSEQKQEKKAATILGTVRIVADSFTHGNTRWEPFKGEVRLDRDSTSITVADSRLCGIPLEGSLRLSGQDVELKATAAAKQEDLNSSVTCLWNKPDLVKGKYDLRGHFTVRGTKAVLSEDGIIRSLQGNLELDARGGRIHRFGLLAKILSMLNVTEIYRGKLPDLVNEGFEYDTITARGDLEGGKLRLEELTIAAPSMKMFWQGEVDLVKNEVNLTLLVAPLRTLDRVIDNVPLVGTIVGGSVISIPVQVTGNLDDPTVIPLSPAAIGSKLLGHVKRVFDLPLKVVQPLR